MRRTSPDTLWLLQSPTGVHRQTVVRGYPPGNVGTRASLAAFLFALIVERQIPGWPAALRGGRAGKHARKR
jgi:hypothetical protein